MQNAQIQTHGEFERPPSFLNSEGGLPSRSIADSHVLHSPQTVTGLLYTLLTNTHQWLKSLLISTHFKSKTTETLILSRNSLFL
ncbi:hypothetical protein D3C74_198680 [compost metagenome]